jgi:hypothetical protein
MGNFDDRDLNDRALRALDEAIEAIMAFEKPYSQTPGLGSPRFVDEDILLRIDEINRCAVFVGAAGEVCEACGGSGRKR